MQLINAVGQPGINMAQEDKKKFVLVVDDQPKLLKFIEIDLKLRGFDVITTSDPEEALALIKEANPDIALLDMVMPRMNGFEVIRKIRAENDHLPIIAFSASPGNQDAAMEAGADDFMHKPFDPDVMARRITKLLEPG